MVGQLLLHTLHAFKTRYVNKRALSLTQCYAHKRCAEWTLFPLQIPVQILKPEPYIPRKMAMLLFQEN